MIEYNHVNTADVNDDNYFNASILSERVCTFVYSQLTSSPCVNTPPHTPVNMYKIIKELITNKYFPTCIIIYRIIYICIYIYIYIYVCVCVCVCVCVLKLLRGKLYLPRERNSA